MQCVHVAMNRGLVIANVLSGVLFAAFAVLQLNDTNPEIYHQPSVIDAWSWVIFYALVAMLFFLGAFRHVPWWCLGLGALFCVYEMVTTAPGLYDNLFNHDSFDITGSSMAPTRSYVELSREFLGALIALSGLGFLAWQKKKKASASETAES